MQNYPLFHNEYFKEDTDKNFIKNLNCCDNLVNEIQNNKEKYRKISKKMKYLYLFHLITKNIRMVASYMTNNILKNNYSYINNLSRNDEKEVNGIHGYGQGIYYLMNIKILMVGIYIYILKKLIQYYQRFNMIIFIFPQIVTMKFII